MVLFFCYNFECPCFNPAEIFAAGVFCFIRQYNVVAEIVAIDGFGVCTFFYFCRGREKVVFFSQKFIKYLKFIKC